MIEFYDQYLSTDSERPFAELGHGFLGINIVVRCIFDPDYQVGVQELLAWNSSIPA